MFWNVMGNNNLELGKSDVTVFSDGEFQPIYLESVRGVAVFIVCSTFPPMENLMELLLMIDAAKRASAYKVVAVMPYFGWARQDRKDRPRVSIGAKLVFEKWANANGEEFGRVRLLYQSVDQLRLGTMLSGTCDEYLPYGRVLRDENGDFLRIVEDRDCTPEQKAIRELNVGIYAFDCKALLTSLDEIRNNNAQNEYYLTDVPAILRGKGQRVAVYTAELNEQILGVNTPEQLALTEKYLTRG